MTNAVYIEGKEGTGQVLRARTAPENDPNGVVAPESIASITFKTWYVRTPIAKRLYGWEEKYVDGPDVPEAIQAAGTLDKTVVMLDPPEDWEGHAHPTHNFRGIVPADDMGESDPGDGEKAYWVRIDVTFVPTSGEPYSATWYSAQDPTPA